ncbi:hypothetical protein, partial [Calidifontibacter terrae]
QEQNKPKGLLTTMYNLNQTNNWHQSFDTLLSSQETTAHLGDESLSLFTRSGQLVNLSIRFLSVQTGLFGRFEEIHSNVCRLSSELPFGFSPAWGNLSNLSSA